MRISLHWLKEYVDVNYTAEELAHQLTMLGLEIESIERPGESIDQIYIGQIESIEPHPDADKLVVCQTRINDGETLQIVCGAKNMKVGDKVPTAVVGATLPGDFKIARRKMRGIESQGMMCSTRELDLGDDHSGLMILPEHMPLGADAKPLLGLDDVIFEIEVTPNRGDWASMIGVARELAALQGTNLRIPDVQVKECDVPASTLSSVVVQDAERCPRYMGRVLTDVKVGPSPEWLCKRLIAAGQRPINNIVDITNFVLLETGQPLHAFDYDLLAENRILVRGAAPKERITTLDDEERQLTEEMLVIADAQSPQCVAGIMGGSTSEVGESTTRIFLESAVFNPQSIRKTSRALGLISESSQRFQRGADPEMTAYALERASMLMQEIAGAEVCQGVFDEYPKPLEYPAVTLRYTRASEVLGARIAPEQQKQFLAGLGFTVQSETPESAVFQTPTWRQDVSLEADLIEEVGRFYNYDNIPLTLPRVRPATAHFAPHESRLWSLKHYLADKGLTEVYHWTFSCPEDVAQAGLDPSYQDMVRLENPLSEKQAAMRTSILPTLLNNVARNLNRGAESVAIFELGPVYLPRAGETLPAEPMRLSMALAGQRPPRHWSKTAESFDFYDIKGHVEAVSDFFGVNFDFKMAEFGPMQAGATAEILLGKQPLGHLGQVKKAVRNNFDISREVFLVELDLSQLLEHAVEIPQFTEISPFPPSLRDMAVVLDQSTPAGEVLEQARKAGGKLLQSVEIFDVYQGKPIPEGKKSLALGLTFQAPDRTLKDKDTQKSWDKILKSLEKQFGAELR